MSERKNEADEIELRMRQVRAELREDMTSLVAGARDLTDWTTYVRRYPWLCLGAAAAVGYLVVPSRTKVVQPDAATFQDLVEREKLVVQMAPPTQRPKLASMVIGMATTALINGGLALLSKHVEQFVAGLQRPPPTSPGDAP
jgi:hypothetical protein